MKAKHFMYANQWFSSMSIIMIQHGVTVRVADMVALLVNNLKSRR